MENTMDASRVLSYFKTVAARDREIEKIVLRAKGLEVHVHDLRERLETLLSSTLAGDVTDGGGSRKVGATRAAVSATAAEIETVMECMTKIGKPVAIKQLRGSTGLGPKVIGAALKELAQVGGKVIGPKRGKWSVVDAAADNA